MNEARVVVSKLLIELSNVFFDLLPFKCTIELDVVVEWERTDGSLQFLLDLSLAPEFINAQNADVCSENKNEYLFDLTFRRRFWLLRLLALVVVFEIRHGILKFLAFGIYPRFVIFVSKRR